MKIMSIENHYKSHSTDFEDRFEIISSVSKVLLFVQGSIFDFLSKHASLALIIGFYLQEPGSYNINIDFIWTKMHEYVYQVDIINP